MPHHTRRQHCNDPKPWKKHTGASKEGASISGATDPEAGQRRHRNASIRFAALVLGIAWSMWEAIQEEKDIISAIAGIGFVFCLAGMGIVLLTFRIALVVFFFAPAAILCEITAIIWALATGQWKWEYLGIAAGVLAITAFTLIVAMFIKKKNIQPPTTKTHVV